MITTYGLIVAIILIAVAIALFPVVFGKKMESPLERLLYFIAAILFIIWLLGLLGVWHNARLP